ncbi:GNAT family N-acetyltransferase [Rhodococcus gannanensis]|uniref:GNAT family N-acetyltransferase n=1 Tax=Rhodococcus gannanensis TaxID=1960308 RepID=A0ABW4P8G7_9NOCA
MSDVRILRAEADLLRAYDIFRTAMVGLPHLGAPTVGEIVELFEPGRTLGAFVDGTMVGTADSTGGEITLPGGARVPHAAVTHIGVVPTHTRRGILRALVGAQLRAARDSGDVIATLRASEATIYERFGYGIAGSSASWEVSTRRARLRTRSDRPVRLVDVDSALCARIHAAAASDRPGSIDRSPQWWAFGRRRQQVSTAHPGYLAVCGAPGSEIGYVRYRPANPDTWFGADQRTVIVEDLVAADADTTVALLQFLLSLDLVDRFVFAALPVDSALPWLLTDHRAARVLSVQDETWLRVLDVPRALAARTYRGSGSVVLGVEDQLLPENSARYRITPGGAVRTDDAAQIELDVSALGSVLLGGVRWHQLADSGRVRVLDDAAPDAAEDLFWWPRAAFAGFTF